MCNQPDVTCNEMEPSRMHLSGWWQQLHLPSSITSGSEVSWDCLKAVASMLGWGCIITQTAIVAEASPPLSRLCISGLFCSFPDISVNHLTRFQYITFLLKSAELVSVICKLRTPTNAVIFHKNPNSFKDLSLAQILRAYFGLLMTPLSSH